MGEESFQPSGSEIAAPIPVSRIPGVQLIEKLPEGEKYAAIKQTEGGETVVVILDRFMRRVHAMIPQSGDMMIVDATSNLDRSDTKLFHLMCPSAIGGLPLGTLMVTKEDESTIRVALETLKENLPEDAFYGRGRNLWAIF